MTSILENIVRGLHCYYLFSFFKIIGNIIQTIFLFIMLENNNITLLFQAQIINHIFLFICGIFTIFYLNGFLSKITFKFYFKVFSELFKYGIKFYFGSSINYLFLVSQKIFVNHFGSFELVGIYEIAHRLVTFLKQILTLPLTNYFPILNYGLKKNQLSKNTFYNNLINVFVNKISLFIFILFIFCSYPISFLFFKTIDYFFIITIILLSFGFYINLKSSVIYLEYLSKEIFIKIIIHNLIGLISFLFLSIILNILFPLYAIVLGVTISMIIGSCYLFITYEK